MSQPSYAHGLPIINITSGVEEVVRLSLHQLAFSVIEVTQRPTFSLVPQSLNSWSQSILTILNTHPV